MPQSSELQFRVTLWPDAPLGRQPLVVVQAWRDGNWIQYPPSWDAENLQPFEWEWSLRKLPDLDLDDPDIVAETVARHGLLTGPFDVLPLPDLRPMRATDERIRIDHAAAYLKLGRAMVNHWLATSEGSQPAQAWQQEGFNVADELVAERYLQIGLNTGLRPYSPRMEIETRLPPVTKRYPPNADWPMEEATPFGAPRPDLFSGISLDVFNLFQESLPVRRCANENCQQRFQRQDGRAETDQRRTTGVLFCSKSCNDAQKQRDYRRRKKKEAAEATRRANQGGNTRT
ncbi:MAG: hypothetical protein GY788_22430 [bacterium]|nr:hypothetical protein [bacterium]